MYHFVPMLIYIVLASLPFYALVLWLGVQLVIEGELTVGQLIAFNMLSGQVDQSIIRLAQRWQDFQQFRISLARLDDVLNTPAEPASKPGQGTLPKIKGSISFQSVTFRYRPDTPEVLHNLSLDIKADEVIGIVGRSGSLSCLTVQPIALRMGGVGLCWAGADVTTFGRYHR